MTGAETKIRLIKKREVETSEDVWIVEMGSVDEYADFAQIGCNSRDAAAVEAMTAGAMQHIAFKFWTRRSRIGAGR